MQRTEEVIMPKVVIRREAWQRILGYIEMCSTEIGGFGTVKEESGQLVVTEVFLIEQEAGAVDFVLDDAAHHAFLNEWVTKGRDVTEFKFWWHSHVYSPTFWSHLDETTIQRLTGESYLISLVGNKQREFRARLNIAQPVPISIDDIAVIIDEPLDPLLLATIREEVAQKVRPKSFDRFWGVSAGHRLHGRIHSHQELGPPYVRITHDKKNGK